MGSLTSFLREKSRLSVKDRVRFELRTYQIESATSASLLLARGRNVIVDLPTGAGKTNIAFICAASVALKGSTKRKKVLFVVPTRILVHQVSFAASWLSPEVTRIAVTPQLAGNVFGLRAAIAAADVVISTPGIMASLLRSGRLDEGEFCTSLAFVVVDEFDEFLTVDPTHEAYAARLEDDFRDLELHIKSLPKLMMSGTAPQMAAKVVHSSTADLLARFIETSYRPKALHVPERKYRDYVPMASVHLRPIADTFVTSCDAALKYRQQKVISEFECDQGLSLDRDYLMERLAAIAAGAITRVLSSGGRLHPVSPELRLLCRKLLSIVNMYAFLFEDMFADLSVTATRVRLVIDCEEQDRFVEVPVLKDARTDSEFRPRLRNKAEVILEIIKSQKGKKGVVLTRHVRLSDSLAHELETKNVRVLVIDGRLSESQRFLTLDQFNQASDAVLVLTRTTGKRGLDIPTADYAVVYSPKEDEYVMWQELSRIRSTLTKRKESHILFYEATAEENKAHRLSHDMVNSAHHYKFVSHRLWKASLTDSGG